MFRKIYANVNFPDDFQGKHRIEGFWFRPDGSLQERTKMNVAFLPSDDKQIFMWLQSSRKRKAYLTNLFLEANTGKCPVKSTVRGI